MFTYDCGRENGFIVGSFFSSSIIFGTKLNFRDLIMIDGGYGPIGGKPPFIPISDGAGIVKEVGKSIKNFKLNDHFISKPL